LSAAMSGEPLERWWSGDATTPKLAALRTAEWERADDAARERFQADVDLLAASGGPIEWPAPPAGLDDAPGVLRTIMLFEEAHAGCHWAGRSRLGPPSTAGFSPRPRGARGGSRRSDRRRSSSGVLPRGVAPGFAPSGEREGHLDRLAWGLREVELGDLRLVEVLSAVGELADSRRPAPGAFEDHRGLELVRHGELVQRADAAGDHDHRGRRADREGAPQPANDGSDPDGDG